MTIYNNTRPDAVISSVEIVTGPDANICFFHINNAANKVAAKQNIISTDPFQEFIAETEINKHPLLVTHTTQSPNIILKELEKQGEYFEQAEVKKPFNAWWWRGAASTAGQALLLVSSFKSSKATSDRIAIGTSASTNLFANAINMTLGSQQKDDPHQLRLLKNYFNQKLQSYLPGGETFPSPDEKRLSLRADSKDETSLGDKAQSFLKRHSVKGGDVGLRVVGSISLAYPVTKWKTGWDKIAKGKPFQSSLTSIQNENPYTYTAGLLSMLGKVSGLAAKESDPYNPKPHSWVDTLREKMAFHFTSLTEASAAAVMAYDRLKNREITFGNKVYRDYFGGIGNLIILGGYGFRAIAPYGTREVNLKELNAHISDSLAKLPPEKLPQIIAEVAVDLKQHLKDKGPELSHLYMQIVEDLAHYHHISLTGARGVDGVTLAEDSSATKSFTDKELQKLSRPTATVQL